MGIFDFFKKKKKIEQKEIVLNEELKSVVMSLCRKEILINMNEFVKVSNPRCSKIGGKPFLPSNFVWPTLNDETATPLSFLCQINLGEINKYNSESLLPNSGMLYFFYECDSQNWSWGPDSKETGNIRVYYYENIDGFVEFELPIKLEQYNIIPEISIDFTCRNSYPSYDEFTVFNDFDTDGEEYDYVLENLGVDFNFDEISKLLGYADIIQNEMITECESSIREDDDTADDEFNKSASEWILLLQIGTIEKADFEMMFGDCGKLYFYIKKSDLLARNFDNVLCLLQCY